MREGYILIIVPNALMASTEGKPAPKTAKNKSAVKLIPEALAADLHVLEDEDLIRSLGREKFVELCIHGSQGWQEGVRALTFISFLFVFIFLSREVLKFACLTFSLVHHPRD